MTNYEMMAIGYKVTERSFEIEARAQARPSREEDRASR